MDTKKSRYNKKFIKVFVLICAALIIEKFVYAQKNELSLRDFVMQIYEEGLDFKEAEKYNTQDLNSVVNLLNSKESSLYWGNVAIVIGMHGNSPHVNTLHSFIISGNDNQNVQITEFQGRMVALTALGIMGNREIEGVEEILEGFAKEKESIKGIYSGQKLSQIFGSSIRGASIRALGICASEHAVNILDTIKKDASLNQNLLKTINEAEKLAQELKNGDKNYKEVLLVKYKSK